MRRRALLAIALAAVVSTGYLFLTGFDVQTIWPVFILAAVIGSCDTDGVSLTYTNTYDATLGRYQTTGVNVTGIAAACAGKALALTLKDSGGVALGSGTVASIVGTSSSITLTAPGANANAVVGAAVVISG